MITRKQRIDEDSLGLPTGYVGVDGYFGDHTGGPRPTPPTPGKAGNADFPPGYFTVRHRRHREDRRELAMIMKMAVEFIERDTG